MGRLMVWAAGAVLAVALAGCAGTPSMQAPCKNCQYGVVEPHGRPHLQKFGYFCTVDGKKVDCGKNPAECPTCKK